MSTENATTCPACGARLAKDADVCDLCGTPVEATELPQVEDPNDQPADVRADEATASPDASASEGVFCNACGWENPPGARYCSQCGEALQEMSTARSKPVEADLPRGADEASTGAASEQMNAGAADDEPSDEATETASLLTRQVGLTVGLAILVIVGLFAATTWSQQMDWGASDAASNGPVASSGGAAGGGAQPMGTPSASGGSSADLATLVQNNAQDSIPEQLRTQIATLEDEIAARSGEEQRAKQQELANLYVGAGQLGRAALVQRRIAEANGQAEAWRRTGDLLYSWMEALEGKQPVSSAVAEHVVTAYQNVLEQQPDNLDVRTDMATAYLQTNQPMRGVEEINRVLETDPNHFQARFNKGIMLTMIGRAEEAIQQFEQVKTIVGAESPYYQQANQAIETIRQRMNGGGSS
jgi:thioredoxin-like negative regulator of GroEL/ribosomal protein L40E